MRLDKLPAAARDGAGPAPGAAMRDPVLLVLPVAAVALPLGLAALSAGVAEWAGSSGVAAGLVALGLLASLALLLLARAALRRGREAEAAAALLQARVTERTHALAGSEAEFRAAFEQSAVPMMQSDCTTTRVLRANAAFCRLVGRSEAELRRLSFVDITHPEDRERDLHGFHRMASGEAATYEAEKRYVLPDGSCRWVRIASSPVRDAAGRPLRSVAVVHDITDRRAAERALALSEERLRRVQRVGRVGGFEIDFTTGENRRSAEYMTVQGLPASSRLETHADWVARLHPADRDRAERAFLDSVAEGSTATEYAQEYRIHTPDGELRWIAARAEIERDAAGRALRMVGAHVDVTELKAAEAARAASEAQLRLAQEAAGVGTFSVDPATGHADVSPGLLLLAGRDPDRDAVPDAAALLALVHPEDRERVAGVLRQALREGAAEAEFRLAPAADGGERWVLTRGRRVAGRFVGACLDITERKAADARQQLLAMEVDHRAKNALAVVCAAVRLTRRDDPEGFAAAVEGRVQALARAHTLIAENRWTGADLRSLASGELATFLLPAGGPDDAPRAELEGPRVDLAPVAAQAISMVLHELATNATKHGALSVPGGRVSLRWSLDAATQRLRLAWTETGGPPAATPARRGFGSRMLEATIQHQMRGSVTRHWEAEGLACIIEVPLGTMIAAQGLLDAAAE
jgi:PAS domain S-box-containing protein